MVRYIWAWAIRCLHAAAGVDRVHLVCLRDVLSPLRIPVDVLVISEKTYEGWKDALGTVIYEAALEGREVYGD